MQTKYIFITGGVVSSLGKGITAASLGALLKTRKLNITIIKLDPYINLNPGTMSPIQHGEVFVTEDGTETDLDLGHYERFTHTKMNRYNNFTTGKVYSKILKKEKNGDYLGKTIQVIPHITDEIKKRIIKGSYKKEISIIEVGGTVGDIESLPFLEAIRQMALDFGRKNTIYIHLTLVPYIPTANEIKTKPTQHSVKELLSIGIQPDILICRSEKKIPKKERIKISLFCNVSKKAVISLKDSKSIYNIPKILKSQKLDQYICKYFNFKKPKANLKEWEKIRKEEKNINKNVTIGVIGKYVSLPDSYKSVIEALKHGGLKNKTKVLIKLINSKELNKKKLNLLKKLDGILIPGGFGEKGIKGKLLSIKYAREKNIPFFGICLGLQIAIIEFARNVIGIKNANSTEFFPHCKNPIISLIKKNLKKFKKKKFYKHIRLGSKICILKKNSISRSLYKKKIILERHRHKYQVNQNFFSKIEKNGLKITGFSKNKKLIEIVELKNHPWFLACQFHPEFTSTPRDGHPLFKGFIKASKKYKKLIK